MIFYYVLGFVFVILPIVITIVNVYYLFGGKRKNEKLFNILTFTLGPGFTALLYMAYGFKDYNEALMIGGLEVATHSPIASWSMPTVLTIVVIRNNCLLVT